MYEEHKNEGHKKDELDQISEYVLVVILMAEKYCAGIPGINFQRIKINLLRHMVNSKIKKYGTPSNVSGMAGETQFKENIKLPGFTAR